MTTIAYKDGIIAYDSRESSDYIILSDAVNKKTLYKGKVFFVVGRCGSKQEYMDAYFGVAPYKDTHPTNMYVVDEGVVYMCGVNVDEEPFWQYKLTYPHSIGSGSEYAIAAMDCGLTAKEAVKVAAGRDMATGGKIRTYRV